MQAYWFVRIDMPFLLIINQTIYNMDKNKIHGFMDQLNLFLIGAVIGGIKRRSHRRHLVLIKSISQDN